MKFLIKKRGKRKKYEEYVIRNNYFNRVLIFGNEILAPKALVNDKDKQIAISIAVRHFHGRKRERSHCFVTNAEFVLAF